MKLIAFFILALVGTSYANKALMQSLEKIHKDPTGAAILSMISLNIKMKTPLSDVGDTLNNILTDLLAQSQKFESDTTNENDRLNDAIDNDQNLQDAYENAIASLQGTIENSQASLATAQENLANYQQALANEQAGIQDRDAKAAVDIPQFDQDISDLNDALNACQQAVQKMNAYKQSAEGSASFIQMGTSIKDRIKKATDAMQNMRKKLSKHSNMFTPLIRELIDLSSSLDQSKADKVISLLSQLVQLLSDALNNTQNGKASYISDYNDKQADAKNKVSEDQAIIDQDQQTIDGLNAKIDQAQSDLAATQAQLADIQAKLGADQGALQNLQNDYAARRPRYDSLIALVRQIIDFYQQNLASVDDYVSQAINASL